MKAGRSIIGGDDHQRQMLVIGRRDTSRIALFLVGAAVSFLVLYLSAYRLQTSLPLLFSFSAFSSDFNYIDTSIEEFEAGGEKLSRTLGAASTENKTVIITTLNKAWAEPNSTFDLFLESFRVGEGTARLLSHVVVVCLDEEAYTRCYQIHRHCYFLATADMDFSGEKQFMTPDYLKLMWRRIQFLGYVLQMGYSFIFTDADIMWFRDPFSRLLADEDFQIACDHYTGNPYDIGNNVNGGFTYIRSNNRTVQFYKFWYSSRLRFPGSHDQDVFNKIKRHPFISKIGLKIRFLDTLYFGGFCEPSKDIDLVCTMHANCCIGVENKVKDLRQVVEDWRKYWKERTVVKGEEKRRVGRKMQWKVQENCRRSMGHRKNKFWFDNWNLI